MCKGQVELSSGTLALNLPNVLQIFTNSRGKKVYYQKIATACHISTRTGSCTEAINIITTAALQKAQGSIPDSHFLACTNGLNWTSMRRISLDIGFDFDWIMDTYIDG